MLLGRRQIRTLRHRRGNLLLGEKANEVFDGQVAHGLPRLDRGAANMGG